MPIDVFNTTGDDTQILLLKLEQSVFYKLAHINKYLILLALPILGWSGSAWAGLFGPSNYDECILDGVKTASNKAAVSAVYDACERKFQSPEDKRAERERKALIKKCRIPEKADSVIAFIGVQNNPEVWPVIENIKNRKFAMDGL